VNPEDQSCYVVQSGALVQMLFLVEWLWKRVASGDYSRVFERGVGYSLQFRTTSAYDPVVSYLLESGPHSPNSVVDFKVAGLSGPSRTPSSRILGPESSAALQRVTHKIHGPDHIGLRHNTKADGIEPGAASSSGGADSSAADNT
jgi:hypothetical protein